MSKVAILLSTIDRFSLLDQCIGTALRTAGYPFGLFWCDNGSTDPRVSTYMHAMDPVWCRENRENEGCAQMHNQMLLHATSNDYDLFCLLDNDIEIRRNNWLKELVETYEAIPKSGVTGIHSEGLGHDPYPAQVVDGITVHPYIDTFGTRLFSKNVLDTVGYFYEGYGLYGLIDNEYNCRAHYLGFLNYYLSGPSGKHQGPDVGEDSDYRRMKDASMLQAQPIFMERMARCVKDPMSLYVPPPTLR